MQPTIRVPSVETRVFQSERSIHATNQSAHRRVETGSRGTWQGHNKHSALPILTGVKIKRTSAGWGMLTATDLERFITVRLEQPMDGESMCIVIPYADFKKISSQFGTNDIISSGVVKTGPFGP